ncbi:MAG: 50S ribosomal protein L25 [Spirochaetota bacterium]|nr:MAG: 50S ribosomal protein L25 [Spirochaetota bacterium]
MDNRTLDIKKREATGKGAAKKLRREGYIPAIMYGFKGNKSIAVSFNEFKRLFEEIGEHAIVTLNLEGKEQIDVIVKDFQLDPVKRNIIHVDFFEIQRGQVLRTEIPIKITGTSVGIKKGGILEEFVRDIEIECLPKDIPDSIIIDITELDIGDSIHIRDIEVSDEIKIISNPDQVVLTIGIPSKIVEPVVEEAEEEEEAAPEEEVEEAAEEEKEKEKEKDKTE